MTRNFQRLKEGMIFFAFQQYESYNTDNNRAWQHPPLKSYHPLLLVYHAPRFTSIKIFIVLCSFSRTIRHESNAMPLSPVMPPAYRVIKMVFTDAATASGEVDPQSIETNEAEIDTAQAETPATDEQAAESATGFSASFQKISGFIIG